MVFLFGKTANSETICYDIKKNKSCKICKTCFLFIVHHDYLIMTLRPLMMFKPFCGVLMR